MRGSRPASRPGEAVGEDAAVATGACAVTRHGAWPAVAVPGRVRCVARRRPTCGKLFPFRSAQTEGVDNHPYREIPMKLSRVVLAAGALALGFATSALAQDNKLRLLTWGDYAPADVIAQFKKETGIDVEVTLSNNEEMISKLRATGGAGFDLAQPSQDRIVGF